MIAKRVEVLKSLLERGGTLHCFMIWRTPKWDSITSNTMRKLYNEGLIVEVPVTEGCGYGESLYTKRYKLNPAKRKEVKAMFERENEKEIKRELEAKRRKDED